jgi:Flp pilus assembly protein TadD
LALDPHLVRARYQLAVCHVALGKRREAREEFEKLHTETGGDPNVIYYLGRLDLLDGDLDTAIRRLKSLALDPPFPDTAYYLGSAYLSKGDFAPAEQWLRKAAEADPRDFRVPDHLARTYLKEGRREEAEREFQRSAELRERYNDTARVAVNCSRELETKPLEEARATCQQLSQPGDPGMLTTLGMLYGQHGYYLAALPAFEEAARLDPESSEVQHDLGLTYFRLKRYSEARGPLEHAVTLRPDFFGSSALLGATLYTLKEDETAYRVLSHAHELNPQEADTQKLLFNTALVLASKKLTARDYAACVAYLQKAVECNPDDAEVHRRLAAVYTLMGRQSEAEAENREAERLNTHP